MLSVSILIKNESCYLFRLGNIERIVFDISKTSLSFAQVETYCANHKY